jgi:F0F1-type ATP synthase membrane subunit b/b'
LATKNSSVWNCNANHQRKRHRADVFAGTEDEARGLQGKAESFEADLNRQRTKARSTASIMGEVGARRRTSKLVDDDEAMLGSSEGTRNAKQISDLAKEAKEGTPSQVDRLKSDLDTIGEKSAS